LNAVGIGVAIAGGLGEIDAGLLVALAHSVNRLLREALGTRLHGCGYIGMKRENP
jgi:hypothetical protein